MSANAGATTIRVREVPPGELPGWDGLIRGFPNHRVTHTRAWLRSLESAGFGSPRFLVIEKEGVIVACLPGLVSDVGPFRLFASPPPDSQTASMGPVFDQRRVTTMELMEPVTSFLEQQYNIHHIEIVSTELHPGDMRGLGFQGETWPTYRLPLYPEDQRRTLFQFKESARRNITRGVKQGLEIRFESDTSFVNEHYRQIREVCIRDGQVASFTRQRVLECFRALRNSGTLAAVSIYLPNRVNIATGMFTIDGRELVLWTWGQHVKYRWHRPIELMTWSVIQRALNAGCNTFDLTSLGELRTRFGAELDVTRYRWIKSRYRWLASIRELAAKNLELQRSLRGRVARLGAPVLLRGLEPIPSLRDVLRR